MNQPVRMSITLYDEDDNPMGWPISAFGNVPTFAASVLGKDPGMGASTAGGFNFWRKGWPKSVTAGAADESVESRARRWNMKDIASYGLLGWRAALKEGGK